MKLSQVSIILILALSIVFSESFACTTAIISGKNTPDGRPLLWKHRDTPWMGNKLQHFTDGKYTYVGLINTADREGKEVWGGSNSEGFCIMNSASFNLECPSCEKKDLEGIIMKLALQNCSSLADFEKMLDTLSKPWGVGTNFGVIDALGGAAYYETNNDRYVKIDVNDPKVAPLGYVVRSNFSVSGDDERGVGYIRYQTAAELYKLAAENKNLSIKYIIQDITRSLKHSLLDIDLYENLSENTDAKDLIWFEDYIPRYYTTTTLLIQGVKKGEDPKGVILWTVLGFPLTSVTFPVWMADEANLPSILIGKDTLTAEMCDKALELKKKVFPLKQGSGKLYVDRNVLVNKAGTGYIQQITEIENQIFAMTDEKIKQWNGKLKPKDIQIFYTELETLIKDEYKKRFGL